MKQNFIDELKRLQPYQNEALNMAIQKLKIREDKPISSDQLKKLVSEVEKNIINLSEANC